MKSRKAASRKAPDKKKASRATATAKKKSPQKSAVRSRSAEKPKQSAVKAKTKSKVEKAVKSKDREKDKKLKPKSEVKKKVSAKADKLRDKVKAKVSAKPSAEAKAKLKPRSKAQEIEKVSVKAKAAAASSSKRVDKATKKVVRKKGEALKPKASAAPVKAEKLKLKAKAVQEAPAKPSKAPKAVQQAAPKVSEKAKAELKGKAELKPKAELKGKAELKPKTELKGKAELKPKAELKGKAELKPKTELKGKAELKPKAELKGKAELKPKTELKAKVSLESKGIAAVKVKPAAAPPPPLKPSVPVKAEPAPREKEKPKIEPKPAPLLKDKVKPAIAEVKEAPRVKLKPAIETKEAKPQGAPKGTVSIKDGNVRILFPRWFRGPLEGLIASYLSSEFTDNGPHSLAVTLGQAFADLVADRLGAETLDRVAALLGSPNSENSQFVKRLSRALERGFEEREDGALLEEVDEAWLVKTFLNALGISFSPRKYVAMRLLTRPLFEKAIADVLMEIRGSTTTPRAAALRIVDAVNAVAKRCSLGEMEQRIVELRQREPRLEVVLASRLDGLRLGSAPPSQWRELGFPDVAARGKDERENVGSSSPIWIARERDASMVLDRLADIADLSWTADGAGGEVQSDEARLAEAGLVKTYRLDGVFAKGDTLRHSTFGLGVVTVCTRETIEVAFPGGMKKLAHGRTLT